MSQEIAASQLSSHIAGQIQGLAPSLVRIGGGRRPASGIVWSKEGLIATVSHFTRNGQELEVEFHDGTLAPAALVARDRATDLALLQVEVDEALLAVPDWIEEDGLQLGHLVFTLARSKAGLRTTMGIVSGLGGPWRTQMGGELARYIEVDASLPEAGSGGMLFDLQGRIVGLNSRALLKAGATIPTRTVRAVLQRLQDHGSTQRGYLGVSVQAVRLPAEAAQAEGQERGLLITDVADESPAEQGGVLLGDVLLELGGHPTASFEELVASLAHNGNTESTLRLWRAGQPHSITLTLGTRKSPC